MSRRLSRLCLGLVITVLTQDPSPPTEHTLNPVSGVRRRISCELPFVSRYHWDQLTAATVTPNNKPLIIYSYI